MPPLFLLFLLFPSHLLCQSFLPPFVLLLLLLLLLLLPLSGGEMTVNSCLNYNLTFHPDFTLTGFSFIL